MESFREISYTSRLIRLQYCYGYFIPLQTPGRKLNELILISGQEKTFSKSNITNTLVMLKKAISDKKNPYFQTNVNQLIFFWEKDLKILHLVTPIKLLVWMYALRIIKYRRLKGKVDLNVSVTK